MRARRGLRPRVCSPLEFAFLQLYCYLYWALSRARARMGAVWRQRAKARCLTRGLQTAVLNPKGLKVPPKVSNFSRPRTVRPGSAGAGAAGSGRSGGCRSGPVRAGPAGAGAAGAAGAGRFGRRRSGRSVAGASRTGTNRDGLFWSCDGSAKLRKTFDYQKPMYCDDEACPAFSFGGRAYCIHH